jgi:hypothetical protein
MREEYGCLVFFGTGGAERWMEQRTGYATLLHHNFQKLVLRALVCIDELNTVRKV